MKAVRDTLETLTQCILLPGVELKFDDVMLYLNKRFGSVVIKKAKRFRF